MPNGFRILRIKTEESFGWIFETAPKFYDLHVNESSHFVVHSRLDEQGKRRRFKAKLDSKAVTEVLGRLERLQVPVAPESVMGCDGGGTTLVLRDSQFCWWSVPPQGWEELDQLTGQLLDLFHASLPQISRSS